VLLEASSIAKSFSVAETPPELVPPADVLVDEELLHATAPSRASATAATAIRLHNRSIAAS
jgi:Asp/Glu/hydantoin racemase